MVVRKIVPNISVSVASFEIKLFLFLFAQTTLNSVFAVCARYNPVLQAVVTVTEELAYQQAKEADHLLSNGVYLGTFMFISKLK